MDIDADKQPKKPMPAPPMPPASSHLPMARAAGKPAPHPASAGVPGRFGNYDILREIGRGSMGVVFEATDRSLGRRVALKVLPKDITADAETLERFKREAEACAKLNHPGIVAIYAMGAGGGQRYYAMEYVEGSSLDKTIERERISFERAANFIMQAAEALQHAHEHGVIHRDIKPANLMVVQQRDATLPATTSMSLPVRADKSDTSQAAATATQPALVGTRRAGYSLKSELVKITDFGLAREFGKAQLTKSGDILGTPAYMSPEQAAGTPDKIGPHSDCYSLGAVLYELLTGQRPFDSQDIRMLLNKVMNEDPPPPRRLTSRIPLDLETITLKAMEKEPAHRYSSAAALADDLMCFLERRPISARPISMLGRIVKWTKRNVAATIGIAATFLALMAGIGGTFLFLRQARLDKIEDLTASATNLKQGGNYEASQAECFKALGLDPKNTRVGELLTEVSYLLQQERNREQARLILAEAQKAMEAAKLAAQQTASQPAAQPAASEPASSFAQQAKELYEKALALDPTLKDAVAGITESALRLEVERNRPRLDELLKQGGDLRAALAAAMDEITTYARRAKEEAAKLIGHEDFATKKPLWDTERELQRAEAAAQDIFNRCVSAYMGVLGCDGENAEAKTALASLYFSKFEEAKNECDPTKMAYYASLVTAYDDGTYLPKIQRDGTLMVMTDPPDATVYLFKYLEGPDRRLIPSPFCPDSSLSGKGEIHVAIDPSFDVEKTIGTAVESIIRPAPMSALAGSTTIKLPAGSYILLVRKEGYVDCRYPVFIGHGENASANIPLVKPEEFPPPPPGARKRDGTQYWVYVPPGAFIAGGDKDAPNSGSRELRDTGGFFIGKFEVACREYLEFVNSPETLQAGEIAGANLVRVPRQAVNSGPLWHMIGGKYQTPPGSLELPVTSISWQDAAAYCEWLGARKEWQVGERLVGAPRLPTEWEWERAARGADGRWWPFGNSFDWCFCKGGNSRETEPRLEVTGAFPLDESPFGVHDMAGSAREWCGDWFMERQKMRPLRGGAWCIIVDGNFRCAFRTASPPDSVYPAVGFRVLVPR